MEKYTGEEALVSYSFRDVCLTPTKALKSLTSRTRNVFTENIDIFIADLSGSQTSANLDMIDKLKALRENSDQHVKKGGLSMASQELFYVYSSWGNLSYKNVVEKFVDEVFPTFFDKNYPRNPGTACIGYALDLLRVLDPKVAMFDDGVKVIIETIRKSRINNPFFVWGAMIDDSIHLRGTENTPFDLFADKEGAGQLKDSFLRFTEVDEREEFEKGINIGINELSIRNSGFSLN